jgi:hypothetical protein
MEEVYKELERGVIVSAFRTREWTAEHRILI